MKIKKLQVTVGYKVGLGDIDMPEDVYQEICKATENGNLIDFGSNDYPLAAEWLKDNIQERDCFDWVIEVEEIKED